MAQALYRKYRSRSFNEIVGQKGVVTALKNALKTNTISHAYLFTGPRGVGKTSVARIMAFAINKISYDTDELPVDIIEIDAASNRGIDEVRDLREKVRIAPVIGPYKIYIIDEVHMLTSHAFNALLKTLEEPPAHVVFILATTESHKLPETITSRTQRYNFTLASTQEVTEHLSEICQKESLDVSDEALTIIAKSSGGSLRDALSLLDHARHIGTTIAAEDVRRHIGVPSDELVNKILTAVSSNNPSAVLDELTDAETGTISAVALARQLITEITKRIQLNDLDLPLATTTVLLHSLVEVESSTQQDIALRIALLSAIHPAVQPEIQPIRKTNMTPNRDIPYANTQKTKPTPTIDSRSANDTLAESSKSTTNGGVAVVKQTTPANSASNQLNNDTWTGVLEEIRRSHNTLYSVLRMAKADLSKVEKHIVTLQFKFPFHQKRISDRKNKDVIRDTLASMGYGDFRIVCEAAETGANKSSTEVAPDDVLTNDKDPLLGRIRGVFGSAEILE